MKRAAERVEAGSSSAGATGVGTSDRVHASGLSTAPERALALQRAIGNRAATRMLLREPKKPAPPSGPRVPKTYQVADRDLPRVAADPELAQRALQFRVENDMLTPEAFRQNVAVIKYEQDGKVDFLVRANDPRKLHSEVEATKELERLDPGWKRTQILEVYTERHPCASCWPNLRAVRRIIKNIRVAQGKSATDFRTYYSVPKDEPGMTRASELAKQYYSGGSARAPGSSVTDTNPPSPATDGPTPAKAATPTTEREASAGGATSTPAESGWVTGGELPVGSVFATHQANMVETDPRIVTVGPQHPAPHAPEPSSAIVPVTVKPPEASAAGGTPAPVESGSVTGGELPAGSVFATRPPSILDTDPRIVTVAPQQPGPHAAPPTSVPTAAQDSATGPSQTSETPVPAARPTPGGEPEAGPVLTPAGQSFGSQVASSAAVGGLALGAMMLQGWVSETLGKDNFDLALKEARPVLDALVRAQSLSVEAIRARSPHHTVYARVHVWETTMYTGHMGPNMVMMYFASPPAFTIAPSVSFTESVPQETDVWHPMYETGFGWYTDVREYNIWFEVNARAVRP
jgi:hypothetical protein